MRIDSAEEPDHERAISSPEEKEPSPFESRNRNRSRSASSWAFILMLNSVEFSTVMLCHHEAVILSLETSWKAVSLSKCAGWLHPKADTESTLSGTVDTTWTASTPLPSAQSVTTRSKPDSSAAM